MKAITFRVDEELFKKAEERRGDRKRSEFYRSILTEYLTDKPAGDQNKDNQVLNVSKETETLQAELEYKDAIIKTMKDERIKDMQSQLNFLQMEYQKLSSQVFKAQARKWWQFWK